MGYAVTMLCFQISLSYELHEIVIKFQTWNFDQDELKIFMKISVSLREFASIIYRGEVISSPEIWPFIDTLAKQLRETTISLAVSSVSRTTWND